jgi:hypothetical protein
MRLKEIATCDAEMVGARSGRGCGAFIAAKTPRDRRGGYSIRQLLPGATRLPIRMAIRAGECPAATHAQTNTSVLRRSDYFGR